MTPEETARLASEAHNGIDRQSRIRRLAKQGKLPTGNDRLLAAIMGKPTPQQAGEQA